MPLVAEAAESLRASSARWLSQLRLGVVPWHGCNLRCKHCYVGDSSEPGMDPSELLPILHDAEALGIEALDVSGGELFDWPHADTALDALVASPLSVNIATNGSLLDRGRVARLARGRVVICLSLDGPEPVHDALRGRGAFASTANAAALCREHEVPFELCSTVTKRSLPKVADTIEQALALGAVSIRFSPMQLLGGRSGRIEDQILDDEDCVELLARLTKHRRDVAGRIEVLAANIGMRAGALTNPCAVYACWGEFCPSKKFWPSRLFVMPDGEVLPQSQHVHRRYSLGNVREQGFRSVVESYWESPRHQAFQTLSRHIYQDRIHGSDRPFYFWDELAHQASAIPTEQLPVHHTVSHPHDHSEEIERLRRQLGDGVDEVLFPLPIG